MEGECISVRIRELPVVTWYVPRVDPVAPPRDHHDHHHGEAAMGKWRGRGEAREKWEKQREWG